MSTTKAFELRPSAFIEFEEVKPEAIADQVRKPVDDALANDPLSINFERRKDSKPTSTERMLAGITIDWLVGFPVESRPKALCERFPHVANRLAKDWADKARSAQSLQALGDDTRWGSA